MSKLSIEVCVKALNAAALNRKQAFQVEMAVGLAIFHINKGTTKDARAMLTQAYSAAGYQCVKVADIDYKTINRRVNTSADLYNTLKGEKVARWAGRHGDESLIDTLVSGLQPYELYGVRDVERFCEPPAPRQAKRGEIVVKPATDIVAGPPTGQANVLQMFRRAAAEVAKGATHIETEHLAMMVPDAATGAELMEMAHRLLSLAEQRMKVPAAA